MVREDNFHKNVPLALGMNKRTAQNQRKVRIPVGLKKRPKKEKVQEVVEPACEITGCGCGN
jgi:hypothetical protein